MSDYALRSLVLLLIAIAIGGVLPFDGGSTRPLSNSASKEPVVPWAVADNSDPTDTYRFTKNGWEDSAQWHVTADVQPNIVTRFHPLLWSLLMILVVCGLAVLASDEKEVRRLWAKA